MSTDVFPGLSRKLKGRNFNFIRISLSCALIACASGCGAVLADSARLQGQVEETGVMPSTQPMPAPLEPMPVPVVKPRKPQQGHGELDQAFGSGTADKLHGTVKNDGLHGQVNDEGAGKP